MDGVNYIILQYMVSKLLDNQGAISTLKVKGRKFPVSLTSPGLHRCDTNCYSALHADVDVTRH